MELETRLDSLLSRFHLGVFRCTIKRKRLESNDVFLAMLGLNPPAETATPAELSQLLDSFLELDACVELLDHVLKTGVSQDRELQWRRPDGTVIWIRLSVTLAANFAGETVFDGLLEEITQRKESERLLHQRADAGGRIALLSPREYEVMSLVSNGKTNKVIARQLGISLKTVEMHRSKVMKKLRVDNIADLVRLVLGATLPEEPAHSPPIAV